MRATMVICAPGIIFIGAWFAQSVTGWTDFLRQGGSPESKPVGAPTHDATDLLSEPARHGRRARLLAARSGRAASRRAFDSAAICGVVVMRDGVRNRKTAT